MARLIDYLLSDPGARNIVTHDGKFEDNYESMAEAQVISIDNVARYYFQSGQTFAIHEFPNAAPPFGNFFVDYRIPNMIYDGEKLSRWDRSLDWAGMHVRALKTKHYIEYDRENYLRQTQHYREAGGDLEASEWLLVIRPYGLSFSHKRYFNVDGAWILPVAEDGSVVYARYNDGTITMLRTSEFLPDGYLIEGREESWFSPLLLAISFMHCKNVTLIQESPPIPLSKKFERKHGRPLVLYRTLNIEPMKRILRVEGQSERVGLKQSLHICRGHFKDYRQHGLFGRNKGIYWWADHVRGSEEIGIVDKDYSVSLPRDN